MRRLHGLEGVMCHILRKLTNELELPKVPIKDYPQIYLDFEKMRNKGISEERIEEYKDRATSLFDKELNLIYLEEFDMEHLTEESSHFLNEYCNGNLNKPFSKKLFYDSFYGNCISEATAFFLSNLIKKRKPLETKEIEEKPVFKLYKEHLEYEKSKEALEGLSFLLQKIIVLEIDGSVNIHDLIYLLGYNLGDKIFKSYSINKFTKENARDLIYKDFSEESSALMEYLTLVKFLE
ncbi:MAG: hypothetical protein KKA65_03020 [Nanoarchaeota archaeon]|nr:hypothetical protein [Nanoarchaeota archaeon]MBU4242242.1 hypothetical protein [Nanoarchaeota archaeon]MBU4351822.1 hypothetical protein [Nanoarchaeota archaeon]MBU4456449.1 hypothetical protein [Nanoarchaeota archaeon]MCG2720373.1 hypothetical protein [Nanoarchaeota archaeon]